MVSMKTNMRTLLVRSLAAVALCGSVAAAASAQGLSVSIGAGYNEVVKERNFTFAPNTATVSGGSGSYTYLWTETDNGVGVWNSGGTAASFAPTAKGVQTGCYVASAAYKVTVTDTQTGQTAVSNEADYNAIDTSSAVGPPPFPGAPPQPIGCQ
jgi:hypothetical protein